MFKNLTTTVFAIGTCLVATGSVAAEGQMDHSKMGHDKMDHGTMEKSGMGDGKMDPSKMDHGAMGHEATPGVTEASGTGVVNSINGDKKEVNLTHEPMPELGWPKMTMDLPVTGKVDLGAIKAGDKVTFRLKMGRDKVYRVMEIAPAK